MLLGSSGELLFVQLGALSGRLIEALIEVAIG
jgi:hypothetical protein